MSEQAPHVNPNVVATEKEVFQGELPSRDEVIDTVRGEMSRLQGELSQAEEKARTPGFKATANDLVEAKTNLRDLRATNEPRIAALQELWNENGGEAVEAAQTEVDSLNFRSTASDHIAAKVRLRDAKNAFYENLQNSLKENEESGEDDTQPDLDQELADLPVPQPIDEELLKDEDDASDEELADLPLPEPLDLDTLDPQPTPVGSMDETNPGSVISSPKPETDAETTEVLPDNRSQTRKLYDRIGGGFMAGGALDRTLDRLRSHKRSAAIMGGIALIGGALLAWRMGAFDALGAHGGTGGAGHAAADNLNTSPTPKPDISQLPDMSHVEIASDATRTVTQGEGWLHQLHELGFTHAQSVETLPKLLVSQDPGVKDWVYTMADGNPGISHTGTLPPSVVESIMKMRG